MIDELLIRERGSARVWRCRLASDRRGGTDATLLNRKKKKKNFFKMTKSVGYVTADVDYLITRGGFPIL